MANRMLPSPYAWEKQKLAIFCCAGRAGGAETREHGGATETVPAGAAVAAETAVHPRRGRRGALGGRQGELPGNSFSLCLKKTVHHKVGSWYWDYFSGIYLGLTYRTVIPFLPPAALLDVHPGYQQPIISAAASSPEQAKIIVLTADTWTYKLQMVNCSC